VAAPVFFSTPAAFRRWLLKHHATAPELLVGFYKVGTGRKSVTWSLAVDEALCVGWIDGIRRSVDSESYSIRFTPRRPGSTWSPINLAKVKQLTHEGRMRPEGLAVFEKRKPTRGVYSYEKKPVRLSRTFLARLKSHTEAWAGFAARPLSYRRTAIFWVMSALQPTTRERRLEHLIAASAAGRPIAPLSYGRKYQKKKS
jgi:uncharacterized protein YdeI (YjbR/CyaY-like superfamily)